MNQKEKNFKLFLLQHRENLVDKMLITQTECGKKSLFLIVDYRCNINLFCKNDLH